MDAGRYTDRTLLILYASMAGVLGISTVVEHGYGTEFIEKNVYHTLWFCCCWGILSLLSASVIVRRRLWQRLPVFLLHLSFLLILAGALVTFLFGHKGYVYLPEGTPVTHYTEEETLKPLPLPFTLRLDSFRIEHYPGTEAPSDYVSHVSADGRRHRISMNRILTQGHYRLYQSSYDEGGSWLSVNHDPWGIGLTYAGYALMALSMCGVLLSRRSGFRTLLRHPLLRKQGLFVLALLLLASLPQEARGAQLPVLNRRQADSLACEQIIYQDRVTIFNTLARDFVKKLTGRETYKGLTPEQVVGGWLLHPEAWEEEPMIRIANRRLLDLLRLTGPCVRLSDLYEGGTYRLQGLWHPERAAAGGKPSALEKAIIETDEKVGLILMLRKGTLIRPLPTDGSIAPLSPARVMAERWYNRLPFSKVLFMGCLAFGLLAFAHLVYRLTNASAAPGRKLRILGRCLSAGLWAALIAQAAGYALRWYVGGRVPLSNGYETMQFMALCLLAVACLMRKRFPFTVPFGFLLAGFALLVSHLGQMNPQITPLMPVLVSPWLSLHVSFIMMSYALLAFVMLNGLLALCLMHRSPAGERDERVEVLTLLSRLMLYPAVFLLACGIFIGAVWANASWGRYWGWDPKEVWALITMMVYALALHRSSLSWFCRPRFFHAFCVVAFVCVLITYFGVNFLLGGMHSYVGG